VSLRSTHIRVASSALRTTQLMGSRLTIIIADTVAPNIGFHLALQWQVAQLADRCGMSQQSSFPWAVLSFTHLRKVSAVWVDYLTSAPFILS